MMTFITRKERSSGGRDSYPERTHISMSTKTSLKYERDAATGQGVHLHKEIFDEEYVYLEMNGFPFEAASSIELTDKGPDRIAVRIPNAWARKLGLLQP
jgi:hypothetical protein